jgi:predicted metal-binding membrane protein
VFVVGSTLAGILMQEPALARAVPMASGVVVLLAGALQFTGWKQRHLACCRPSLARASALPADAATACRYGMRLGLHCVQCCAGLIALLLIAGVMNLAAMVIVAVAITLERLMRAGERVARLLGIVMTSAGLLLIVRAAGIG